MQYLGVFFSVAGAVFLLYLFFVAGVAHNTHTHIQINRTLAHLIPRHPFISGGCYPKPIYEANFAFFGVFHVPFCSLYHHFQKYFQTFLPSRPQNAIKFMSRTPQIFYEIQFHIIIFASLYETLVN